MAACALLLLPFAHAALADCNYETGHSGPLNYEMDMGTLWMPRDAPNGTVIATANPIMQVNNRLVCHYEINREVTAVLTNTAPIAVLAMPLAGNRARQIPILQTKIPGIGATIEVGEPFDGNAVNYNNRFSADPGTPNAIPYSGAMRKRTPAPAQMYFFQPRVTLIKIGPIAAGPQRIDEEMFRGIIDTRGDIMDFRLKATINHAQCTLRPDAVSADPVQLGDHTLADFTGAGSTTVKVPFHIRLNDCQDDSSGSVAMAHIRLDGAKGSSSVDRNRGLFSLTSNSTATGIGIQLLREDGTDMPLEEEVAVKRLAIGETRLNFHARYYQTDAKVEPGLAEGALNFTISYK
jgi:type 1 fimbria pilin